MDANFHSRQFGDMQHLSDFRIGVASSDLRWDFHKVKLASESSFFDMIFKYQETSEFIIPPEITNNPELVRRLHNWLYKRQPILRDRTEACELYTLGCYLGVSSLLEYCQKTILAELNEANAIDLLVFSQSVYSLQAVLFPEVARRFQELLAGHRGWDLGRITFDTLSSLLEDDHLNLENEKALWTIIRRWTLSQEPQTRKLHLDNLITHVRVGLLPFGDFMTLWKDYVEVTGCNDSEFLSRWFDFQVWKHSRSEPLSPEMPRLTEDDMTLAKPRTPPKLMLTMGGWSFGKPCDRMEICDPTNGIWYPLNNLNLPGNRAYNGFIKHEGSIYIFAGYDGNSRFKTMYSLDMRTLEWSYRSTLHTRRCFVPAVFFENHIYTFGGHESDTDMNMHQSRLTIAEKYSIPDNQWTLVKPMSEQRSDCAAAVWNDTIYVLGGFNGNKYLNSVARYYPRDDRWEEAPSMNTPRGGVNCAIVGNKLYALGGFDGTHRLATIEWLNLDQPALGWHPGPSMHVRRSNFGVTTDGKRIHVLGGFNEPFTTNKTEWFDGEKWELGQDFVRQVSAPSMLMLEGSEVDIFYSLAMEDPNDPLAGIKAKRESRNAAISEADIPILQRNLRSNKEKNKKRGFQLKAMRAAQGPMFDGHILPSDMSLLCDTKNMTTAQKYRSAVNFLGQVGRP